MSERMLRPGDPCPCCGQPIVTRDPEKLMALTWLAWVMGKRLEENDGKTDGSTLGKS